MQYQLFNDVLKFDEVQVHTDLRKDQMLGVLDSLKKLSIDFEKDAKDKEEAGNQIAIKYKKEADEIQKEADQHEKEAKKRMTEYTMKKR